MDFFVVDPEWHWWIILYFYLGGIAAGAYLASTLIDLVGSESDRRLAPIGYWISLPLVILCGIFLTVDLYRPERFWHMLFKSEIVDQALAEHWPYSGQSWQTVSQAFLFKHWSPMSVGSWALLIFGLCSFLSCLGSIWSGGTLFRVLRRGILGRTLQVVGCLVGFFIASYTGALITATNQPLWSDTTWIAPLFLASAASTGIAAMLLLAHRSATPESESLTRLKHADTWATALEAVIFIIFLVSLGSWLGPVWQTAHGKVFLLGTSIVGLLLPLLLHVGGGRLQWGGAAAAVLTLVGGFILRYGLLTTPPEILARAPQLSRTYVSEGASEPAGTARTVWLPGFSPEDGRPPGGGRGADPGNSTSQTQPRSKVFHDEQ